MLEPWSGSGEIVWMVVVGFIIAFILAFAVGANDVANSFGTSVGSKVLTLKQACILAVIFETAGALLIGSKVSDTIWKDIVNMRIYEGKEKTLMLGELAALMSAAIWLMIATVMKIPVSGTHSIVGAVMGFSLVKMGGNGIQWVKLGKIVASWFISPILAGVMSSVFFLVIRRFILRQENHLEPALRAMPIFYAFTIFVNALSIFLDGSEMLGLNLIPWWGALIICCGIGIITGVCVYIWVVPWQRREIMKKVELSVANGTDMTPSPSMAASMIDLRNARHSLKRHHKDMSTSTSDARTIGIGTGSGIRGGGMSAATSMTGLTGLSRAPSFIARIPEEVALASVAEHHDEESETGIDLAELQAALHNNKQSLQPDGSISPPSPSGPSYPYTARPKLNNGTATGMLEDKVLLDREVVHTNPATVVDVKINPDMFLENRDTRMEIITPEHSERAASTPGWLCCGPCRQSGNCCEPAKKMRRRLGSHHRVRDPPEVQAVFSFLQILTAAFTAFAHGGNDVCNAIGPLVALWVVYTTGEIPEKSSTAWYLLLFGGFGISVGLSVLGRKVIETVGTNLTPVIPSSGFCIGLGTACTVLVASKLGLPISTTHCIVGSVVAVGWLRSNSQVNWKLFGTIAFGWFVTVPMTVGVSAAAMAILLQFFPFP
ncbi:Sodium-dependent phosphate transporter 1 [Hypsibius exemplaris]|uniref:Phosphate transporter n=1 Tax=Hypsibius exemplaris TaxID=2072580 RepID=A0A1W0W9C8_HYPEX|nr:Sodium-dependent phosphate transporter 1 [Hypsibius exemplaris]